jgi:hypothetical protein
MRRALMMAALGVAFVVGSGFAAPGAAEAGSVQLAAHHGKKHKHSGHKKGHGHKALHRHGHK